MKKGCIIALLVTVTAYISLMLMLLVFARFLSFERFTPTFIAGRDTVAYWNHGEFELIRGSGYCVLYQFSRDGDGSKTLNSPDNSVCAYRERGRMLYIVLEQGYLVIDLDQSAVKKYETLDAMDAACQAVFLTGRFVRLKQ